MKRFPDLYATLGRLPARKFGTFRGNSLDTLCKSIIKLFPSEIPRYFRRNGGSALTGEYGFVKNLSFLKISTKSILPLFEVIPVCELPGTEDASSERRKPRWSL